MKPLSRKYKAWKREQSHKFTTMAIAYRLREAVKYQGLCTQHPSFCHNTAP